MGSCENHRRKGEKNYGTVSGQIESGNHRLPQHSF